MIYTLGENRPRISPDAFVADTATLIGRVEVLAGASIWFGSVLRGDNDLIRIGEHSNVQDGSVIHTDPGIEVIIEDHVTVGHRAVLHGCHIGACSLVGINSVLLNHVRVGSCCLIGANSMITSGKVIPDRSLVLGSPAKIIRKLDDEECRSLEHAAELYSEKVGRYRKYLSRDDQHNFSS